MNAFTGKTDVLRQNRCWACQPQTIQLVSLKKKKKERERRINVVD
jgi:hypothetical protein